MFQKSSSSSQSSVAVRDTSQDAVETVVGPSVVVEGDFSSDGPIIVKGTVSGSVHTSKILTVEEGAKIFANVKAGAAVVSGMVKGNVKIIDRLELKSSAKIAGDVECKTLIVESGALVNGKVMMGGMEGEESKIEKKSGLGRVKPRVSALIEQPAEALVAV